MSIPITTILQLLGQAGLGDIAAKVIDKGKNEDKLKLKFISILIENMDEKGACNVKDIIKELVEKERIFDFDDD